MIEQYDNLEIYCPELGSVVTFRYCRVSNEQLPCRRILFCWQSRFDVEQYLTHHYPQDKLEKALFPPSKTVVEKILEVVEKVKKGSGGHQ